MNEKFLAPTSLKSFICAFLPRERAETNYVINVADNKPLKCSILFRKKSLG
jgi:hypothetical protein